MNNCQASFRQALKALGVYFKDMGSTSSSVILRKSGESRNTSSKAQGEHQRIHIRRSIGKGGLGIIYSY
ncbi:MAG: hypothetical protein NTZ30_05795 [Planctomycetota bacterium]|nr:hypothetical protein [Planctomycetota bacterium]